MKEAIKKRVMEIARLIWDRRLSDVGGGNISIRDEDDLVCMTPKLMGFRYRWQISVDQLSIVTLDGEILEGPKEVTREVALHLGCYNEFPEAHAVIHAHPYWTNVFVAKGRPIKPLLETTEKFGMIGCIEEAHGYSQELADKVISYFKSKADQWEKTPLEVILPRHGIVAMGKDMNGCFDIIDRIESECRCQIFGKILDQ